MSRFLITGLPRSRTAWWAVACSAGGRYCEHEPVSKCWHSTRPGIADSGLAVHLQQIVTEMKPRTLIVERPRAEVLASFREYVRPTGQANSARFMEAAEALIEPMIEALKFEHPLIKRVAFADLESEAVLVDCFQWLQVPVPVGLRQLMHMNIQSPLAHNLAMLAAQAA